MSESAGYCTGSQTETDSVQDALDDYVDNNATHSARVGVKMNDGSDDAEGEDSILYNISGSTQGQLAMVDFVPAQR